MDKAFDNENKTIRFYLLKKILFQPQISEISNFAFEFWNRIPT